MKRFIAAVFALAATPALAADPPAPVSAPLATVEATMTGQPIVMPAGPLKVVVTETVIPLKGVLAPHKHPFPRYAYVLAGRLRVTNLDTGTVTELKAGDFAIDAVDQWHEGLNVGEEAVRLLVIDNAPPGQANMIRKAP